MRRTSSRPARGQALFAGGSVVVLAVALGLLDRAGPKEPAAAPVGTSMSGAWVCPHGGGHDWTVNLFLANPGPVAVTARVTTLGEERSRAPDELDVPAGRSVRLEVPANEPGRATFVEYFGGWIGAGWVATTPGREPGTAAEPCAPEATRRWYTVDATTQQHEDAYVVVANPFDIAAVLDVVIYTADRAPIRDSEWTDLVVPARRSIALPLDSKVEGEPAVATEIDVSVGRVAVASLGITDGSRIRSALGWAGTATGGIFPVMRGSGRAELLLFSTADRTITFGATTLSEDQPRPAGGLTEQEHPGAAIRAYPVPLEGGPEAVSLFTLDDAAVVAALRAFGPGPDPGSTAGAVAPAPAWLVLPAVAGGRSHPGVVLVNPGDEDAVVTVEILAREGGTAAAPVTVDVPAHAAAAVPPGFWETAPGAGLLVRAQGAPVVALAASTSLGKGDRDTFALSMGVPVPQLP